MASSSVIANDPHGPWAPIMKHGVGQNIDVDLIALQLVLLEEPPVVLGNLIPVASLHEGVPPQQREAVMVKTLMRNRPSLKVQYE
jgi:hypothetical protein